jgi:hypothetical protein
MQIGRFFNPRTKENSSSQQKNKQSGVLPKDPAWRLPKCVLRLSQGQNHVFFFKRRSGKAFVTFSNMSFPKSSSRGARSKFEAW